MTRRRLAAWLGIACWLGTIPACSSLRDSSVAATPATTPQPSPKWASPAPVVADQPPGRSPYRPIDISSFADQSPKESADLGATSTAQAPQNAISVLPDKIAANAARPDSGEEQSVREKSPEVPPAVVMPIPLLPESRVPTPGVETHNAEWPARKTVIAQAEPAAVIAETKPQPPAPTPAPVVIDADMHNYPPRAQTADPQADYPEINQNTAAQPDSKTLSRPSAAGREPPLLTALRYYLDSRPADAVRVLNSYDQTHQDLLIGLLSLAAGLTEGDPQKISEHQATVFLDQLRGMAAHLQPLAPFTIGRLCFCEKIREFGKFDELPANHVFRPGEWVQLYAELQNFSTAQHDDIHLIKLASSMEICSASGRQELFYNFGDAGAPDRSLSARHDYCNIISFTVPKDLPPGTHTFHFRVKDLPTKRTATRTLDFVVGPARGM